MPSITDATIVVRDFPNKFISPFSDDPVVPLYSSIPLTRPNSECMPCVICGNIEDRRRVMQEEAAKYGGYTPNELNEENVFVGFND